MKDRKLFAQMFIETLFYGTLSILALATSGFITIKILVHLWKVLSMSWEYFLLLCGFVLFVICVWNWTVDKYYDKTGELKDHRESTMGGHSGGSLL